MATKSITEKRKQELLNLRKRTKGALLKAEDVVKFAKNRRTALHSAFEWDDGKAAHEYRLITARRLIVEVEIIPWEGNSKPIQVNVSLIRDRQLPGGGYRDIVAVLSDKEMREELLEQALRDFLYWQNKYEHLKELAPIIEAGNKVLVSRAKRKRPNNRNTLKKQAVA